MKQTVTNHSTNPSKLQVFFKGKWYRPEVVDSSINRLLNWGLVPQTIEIYRVARNFCGSLFLRIGDFLCFAGTNFGD